MTVRLIAAVIFFLVTGQSCLSADVYRWTDAQGNVFYGNQPPTGARDVRVMFKEQSSPAVGQAAEGEPRGTEAVLQELEDEMRREAEARKEAGSVKKNQVPDQAELVAREKVKLEKKIECGAQFIVNLIGYDSRKCHELFLFMRDRNLDHVPLVGIIFVLSPRIARLFHSGRIPGGWRARKPVELTGRTRASSDRE